MNIFILYVLLGAAAFLVVASLAGGYAGYVLSLTRRKKQAMQLQAPDPKEVLRSTLCNQGKEWFFAQKPEEVLLQSRDGLTLRGYFLPAKRPGNRLLVCSHGYNCNGPDEFGAFLRYYHEALGFHILLPDHRAHGRSDGKYIGFAAREWEDILDWADAFVRRLGPGTQVALHGVSMGGATVMNCNAHNPPGYIKCIVEDCGYTNGYEMISLSVRRDLHIHFPPINWVCALWFRLFVGRSLRRDSDPFGHIANCKTPTLFVHGDADTFVPTEMGLRFYNAAAMPKELLLVPGAGHAMAYPIDPAAYEAKLREFYDQWMKEEVRV
ncbi:MAG: alpha/beta fold hydrolase [Oscillospiraceae bacterium]|jgi:pimeloyl-ACP methyl ester carboxylesterase|nr:alpha/beta fold hydrolase [Oscillospiraceae bacterium]